MLRDRSLPWHTIAETTVFARNAAMLLEKDERDALDAFLANDPRAGDLIEGTGGLRKLRWRAQGRGKRGGVRVIYYHFDETVPLLLLTIYGKGERDDLSMDAKRKLAEQAEVIRQEALRRRAARRVRTALQRR